MSRSIWIGYEKNGSRETIEIRAPYFLLGTQLSSKQFWESVGAKGFGITRLSQLGEIDPVSFCGWEDIGELGREIRLLSENLGMVDIPAEMKAQWLSHLVYCHQLLVQMAPKNSVPMLSIG